MSDIRRNKSGINRPKDQKATLVALGFKRLNQIVEKEDTWLFDVYHGCLIHNNEEKQPYRFDNSYIFLFC